MLDTHFRLIIKNIYPAISAIHLNDKSFFAAYDNQEKISAGNHYPISNKFSRSGMQDKWKTHREGGRKF